MNEFIYDMDGEKQIKLFGDHVGVCRNLKVVIDRETKARTWVPEEEEPYIDLVVVYSVEDGIADVEDLEGGLDLETAEKVYAGLKEAIEYLRG